MRFLDRHAVDGRWALDVGSGPGRFTGKLGGPTSQRVALDLSRTSLTLLREGAERTPDETTPGVVRVQGDASRPPFLPSAFQEVALLGNSLGFGGAGGAELLEASERLVSPGGTLLLEIAPGPGERSRYLSRLPPGTVARLLAVPPPAVIPRILREGFAPLPPRRAASGFRRWTVPQLIERWSSTGWRVGEVLAVAPALGAEPRRISAARASPAAWKRLLELEEILGRDADRWALSAAVLLAARRPPLNGQD